MSDQIKEGDVVQLNSGGPGMTVEKVERWNGIERARCVWFEGSKSFSGVFPLAALRKASVGAAIA